MTDRAPITELLQQWAGGNADALEKLTPLVYGELRRLAARRMRGERRDHTLQPTSLVHEAYLKLVQSDVSWQDRTHFFAVAARMMRRILVDHARQRRRNKRGGAAVRVTLDLSQHAGAVVTPDVLDIDIALDALAALDPRKSHLVELHFFAGLTYPELAQALHISEATVHRELRFAKAWMQRELGAASL
jgi:RNA polymerase sigma factor (TIGR02999 family)